MIDKIFRLSWQKGFWILIAIMGFIAAHNFISGFIGHEEGICFCIALFGLPAYGLICAGYTIITNWRHHVSTNNHNSEGRK